MHLTATDRLLILISIAEVLVFCLFWYDKAQARDHGWRVRESTLLFAAIAGGVGAWFAQHLLRHKTRKEPFRSQLGLMIVAHLMLILGAVWCVLAAPA
ncbi:DUF1294 domain-containing protein [soil metagenome]